ncbi:MAG: sensor histidine kinase N-terminal domain-containing protein, partial [Chloroflexi bacterium]|nr:sensor histidine kinase N-terminal domain-containing protein [Chloroflexota bacterium]
MPIRIRLTLWYTFLLGVILITFSILLYWVLGFSLNDQIDSNLQDRAQQVGAGIQAQAVIRHSGNVVGIEVPELSVFSSPAIFIQVIQTDGRLVTATENLGKQRIPADADILKANREGHSIYKTITTDNTHLR